ncbi:MAG: hypothetical protein V7603_552 [Micromonosporaceae bacterium]
MVQPAVIELGADRAVPEQPDRPARPRTRWLFAAGLALASAMGGAAVPRPGLVPRFQVPYAVGAAFVSGGDTLYVTAHGSVSAYRLPDGARRWSVPAPGTVEGMQLATGSRVLLVSRAEPPTSTVGLDTRTGRQLWRSDSVLVAAVLPGDRQVLLFTPGPGASSLMRAVDVRSGQAMWSRTQLGTVAPTGPWTDLRAEPPRLVFQTVDGGVEVVAAPTGEVLLRGRLPDLPAPGPARFRPEDAQLSTAGDQLLVIRGGDTRTLEAFDLGTLARRWRARLPAAGYFATSCGTVLCVFGPQWMTGVDPGSGALLWHTHLWQGAQALPGGRLLVSSGEPDLRLAIVVAATLRPVLDLKSWRALGGGPGGQQPLVLARTTADLRTWFAVVDPAVPHPVIRTLGGAGGVLDEECLAFDGYLACPTVHNRLQVWRYRT